MHTSDAIKLLFGETADLKRVTTADIKSAFRKRIRSYHPDSTRSALHNSGELVSSLISARDTLISYLHKMQQQNINQTDYRRFEGGNRQQTRTTPIRPYVVRPERTTVEKQPKKENERYYSGVFPTYRLKFGQFVYFAGEVSWQDLVRGIRWQRDQRPPFGEIAKAWGWLTDKDIQAIRAATEIPGMFGERAVSLGLLSEKQAAFLARHQHHCQPRLGEYFILKQILLASDINRLLAAMKLHNTSVEKGRGPIPPFKPAGLVR